MSETIRNPEVRQSPELKEVPAPATNPSMRWHGFLVKLMLRLAAAYHLFQAVWIAIGKVYFDAAVRDAVYSAMPAMRVLDYTCAALLICAAAFLILARRDLSALNPKGIRRLNAAYILLTATMAGYGLTRFLISGLSMLSLPVFGQTAAYAALLLVNRSYYRRRKDMFIEDKQPKE